LRYKGILNFDLDQVNLGELVCLQETDTISAAAIAQILISFTLNDTFIHCLVVLYQNRIKASVVRIQLGILYDWRIAQLSRVRERLNKWV
jgi:hypothetical protein